MLKPRYRLDIYWIDQCLTIREAVRYRGDMTYMSYAADLLTDYGDEIIAVTAWVCWAIDSYHLYDLPGLYLFLSIPFIVVLEINHEFGSQDR